MVPKFEVDFVECRLYDVVSTVYGTGYDYPISAAVGDCRFDEEAGSIQMNVAMAPYGNHTGLSGGLERIGSPEAIELAKSAMITNMYILGDHYEFLSTGRREEGGETSCVYDLHPKGNELSKYIARMATIAVGLSSRDYGSLLGRELFAYEKGQLEGAVNSGAVRLYTI